MAGKGDTFRPCDPVKYAEGWERAFGVVKPLPPPPKFANLQGRATEPLRWVVKKPPKEPR